MSLYIVVADFNLFSPDHRIINPAVGVIHVPSGKPQAHICFGGESGFLWLICLIDQFCEVLNGVKVFPCSHRALQSPQICPWVPQIMALC